MGAAILLKRYKRGPYMITNKIQAIRRIHYDILLDSCRSFLSGFLVLFCTRRSFGCGLLLACANFWK